MKNSFAKNSTWIISGQIIQMIFSFIINTITVRYLGPSDYGIINYASSYIAFFTTVIGLGLNGVIIHEFVNHKDEEGGILGTAIFLRFLLSIISVIIYSFIIVSIPNLSDKSITVAFILAIELPFLCAGTINYWYQYQMTSQYVVMIQTVSYIIISLFRVYLLITNKSVTWFAFAISLYNILIAIGYFVMWGKQHEYKMYFSRVIAKRLLISCIPFLIANIMAIIYGHVDKIMIKSFLQDDELVGLYSAALTICTYIGFIPVAFIDSGRSLVVEAKKNDNDTYRLRIKQLAAIVIWICILFSIFVTIFSNTIINILFGEAYLDANVCLKICVWYTAFSYVGNILNLWLICENQNKYIVIFSSIGTVLNIGLNALLIPALGINGAAIATLITQISINFAIPALFKNTRDYSHIVFEAVIFKGIDLKNIFRIVTVKLKNK